MSEEQNLFEAVAAPPPPRAKRQVKPKAKAAVSATDETGSSRGVEEQPAGAIAPPKRSPRSKKAVASAPASEQAPERAASEPVSAVSPGGSRSGEGGERTSAAHSVPVASHRSDSGEVLVEHRPRTSEPAVQAQVRDSNENEQHTSVDRAERSSAHRIARPETGASEVNDNSAMADGSGAAGSMAGMSKSRRRRRKRKNRAAAAAEAANPANSAGGNAGPVQASAEATAPSAVATVEAPAREFRQSPQGGGQSHHQNAGNGQNFGQNSAQGQNSRRNKKKKFRRAGEGEGQGSGGQTFTPRPPRPEPGNSLQGSNSGGMGQRRNRKQGGGFGDRQNRGPRTFVGPMDHSYREVNGNFADGPASTIQVNQGGRHRNNGHRQFNEDRLPPELMHNSRPVVIPEGAPTHIYFFIEDLFFTAKIQEAAKQQGVKVAFMKPEKDVVAHLSELHDHEHPSLIVFDLNNANAKPLTLIPKLKAKLKKGTSILGFLSHLQGDLKQKAVEAGCHTVMPKSAFSQNLPNLLRRYGVEDEHEPNFNQ